MFRWLEAQFPTSWEVELRFEPKLALQPADVEISTAREKRLGYAGTVEQMLGKSLRISLATGGRPQRGELIEVLLHEWAHVLRWDNMKHDDGFWRCYGRIYRGFYDEGGDRESWEF